MTNLVNNDTYRHKDTEVWKIFEKSSNVQKLAIKVPRFDNFFFDIFRCDMGPPFIVQGIHPYNVVFSK